MADPNQAVFSMANEVMTEAVIRTAGRSAEDFRRELIEFLQKYMANFYSDLVVEGVGGETAPGLLSSSSFFSPWPNLKQDYSDRKGGKNSFYDFSGDLKDHLLGRNAATDFGKPKVKVSVGGQGLSPLVRIDAAGRPQYRRGSGRRGFASYASAFSQLVFSLNVEMFPKLQGKKMKGIFSKFPMAGNIRYKMAVNEFGRGSMRGKAINHPARPLMRPFLDWYGTTNLRLSLAEKFGIGN